MDTFNVWRIQTRTGEKDKKINIAEICLNEGMMAIGCSLTNETLKEIADKEKKNFEEIKEERSKIENFEGYKKFVENYGIYPNIDNVKRLAKDINVGDLVWLRNKGKYYLGKIRENSNYKYSCEPKFLEKDMSNYRENIKWIEIGDESSVPGALTTAFIRGTALQRINKQGIKEFSKLEYNMLINKEEIRDDKYENIRLKKDDFFSFLSSFDCEDLLCLYLFDKKGYVCIPSTNKLSTEHYECVLINPKNGKNIYIQVKNGEIDIDAKDYEDLAKSGEVYLLTTKGKVKNSDIDNIVVVDPKELKEFSEDKNSQNILPKSIKKWVYFFNENSE